MSDYHRNKTDEQFVADFEAASQLMESFSTGSCNDCVQCQESSVSDDEEVHVEPHFSWSPCPVCGSTLGGDRHAAHYIAEGDLNHLDVCTDCLFYASNGDLPSSY